MPEQSNKTQKLGDLKSQSCSEYRDVIFLIKTFHVLVAVVPNEPIIKTPQFLVILSGKPSLTEIEVLLHF